MYLNKNGHLLTNSNDNMRQDQNRKLKQKQSIFMIKTATTTRSTGTRHVIISNSDDGRNHQLMIRALGKDRLVT